MHQIIARAIMSQTGFVVAIENVELEGDAGDYKGKESVEVSRGFWIGLA